MKLLFVCVENSCRSQMAEGFARYYGKEMSSRAPSLLSLRDEAEAISFLSLRAGSGEAISVYSAGSRPSGVVNPMAVDVMEEKGIDILNQKSKGLDTLPEGEFDVLVTMGCGDNCPSVSSKKRVDWQIKDPKGASIEVFREVRDEIEKKVLELLRK